MKIKLFNKPMMALVMSTLTFSTAHALNPQQQMNAASWNYLCSSDPGDAGPVTNGCLVSCTSGNKFPQCKTILDGTGFEQQAGVAMLQAGINGVVYVKKLMTTANSALTGPSVDNTNGTTALVCGLYDVTGKLIAPAFIAGITVTSNFGNPQSFTAGQGATPGPADLFATSLIPVGMPYYEVCIGYSNPLGNIAQYATIITPPTITW